MQDVLVYRMYVADALKMISENTARFAGGSHLTKRYVDIINDTAKETKEKTSEEIKKDIFDTIKKINGGE